ATDYLPSLLILCLFLPPSIQGGDLTGLFLAAAAAAEMQPEQFREEDLPEIFRELSERHSRIERFSKDLAKQTNMANRESAVLQSAILPRPPINSPIDPIDNRLPDLLERSTVPTTTAVDTGHTDYETESVIASPPPPPRSSEDEEKKFLLSERFFETSTNNPKARAAPTPVLPLSTSATEDPSTTVPPTTTITITPSTTTPREEEEEVVATLPSVRRTTPRFVRGLRPLSFPPLPKFLPTRRNALPERSGYGL
ncbi:hypothetical protein PMAYCL1PPCAC_23084, partial [Pristionchus mayeri]